MKIIFLIIIALFVTSAITASYFFYDDTANEQKAQEAFGDNLVYLAMKERFPEITSSVSYDTEGGTGMFAFITNNTNGNELYLTINKGDSEWGGFPTFITCRTINGVDTLYTDDFVVDYIKNTDCLDIGEDPDIVSFAPISKITKDDMNEIFEKHPAFTAFKQRFPDSTEKIEYFEEGGGKLRVNAPNPENRNYLELTITVDQRLDKIPAFATCFVKNGSIAIQQQYNFLSDYITNTACLEYMLSPDYVYPRYDGPVDEDDGILLIKDTSEYKTLIEEYGEDLVSVKAVNLLKTEDTLFLKDIDGGFKQDPGCIIVMKYQDNQGSIYQLDENLDIVYKMNLTEFMEKSSKQVDVDIMNEFYSSLH